MQSWVKKGSATVLAQKYGKSLVSHMFQNLKTGAMDEFVMYGQRDWSVILALTEKREVIAVKQFKQGCNKIIEELPAGTADFGDETPEAVVIRELREETGYCAQKILPLGSYWIASRSSWTRFHCFLGTGCTNQTQLRLDKNEDIEVYLVPLRDWIQRIMSDTIEEPSAIVATFRALPHLGFELMQHV